MKKYPLLFSLFSSVVWAETVIEHNIDPISFERHSQAVKFEQNVVKNSQKPTAYQPAYSFNQNLEQQINQAILNQDWATLEPLLSRYPQTENFDLLLWHYAHAALAYAKKDHQTAVFHYRQLLVKNPSLVYPRFDLALILAGDQQFRAAEQEFKAIQAHLPPELAKIARNTQAQIAENEAWQPDFYLQYTQTDNVNNASSSPIVNVNGRKMQTVCHNRQKACVMA